MHDMAARFGALIMSDLVTVGGGADAGALANLAAYAEQARGAHSANTLRAIKADTTAFAAWCSSAGLVSLPANPDTLARFVDAMAADKAPATVRRYVASIAHMHRAAGIPANPAASSAVKLALKRMHRAKGRAQQQAAPLNWDGVRAILKTAPITTRGLRNRAVLALAYDTLCRRSELVALQVSDLKVSAAGDGTVFLRRSKTDQEGEGTFRYVAADTVREVSAWLAAAHITDGALFRTVNKAGGIGGPMDAGDVARVYKELAAGAGLDAAHISGHSTRVGAAQDMTATGQIEMPAIMQAAGWKTPTMPARYASNLSAKRSGAAKLAVLQNRG